MVQEYCRGGRCGLMENSVLFSGAVCFAADKHKTQVRRDGSPYILHPIKVAEIVRQAGYDIKYQIAALLHDTLEDTDATEEEIRFFGDDVYEAVSLLTRPDDICEEEYINKILDNRIATVVKAADKMHNMYEAGLCEDKQWAIGYIKKSQKYYLGKFNRCVDDSIRHAYYMALSAGLKPTEFSFKKDDMKLFKDIEKEKYEIDLASYNESEWPTRVDDAIYYKMEFANSFLYEENGQFYALCRFGWKKLDYNPIFSAKTPEEEYPLSSVSEFEAFISGEKQSRKYFWDFVNIEKL